MATAPQISSNNPNQSTPAPSKTRFTRRGLLVRDSLTFVVLSLATIALYGVTLFLFRSFEAHRDDLAKRWSERGEHALQTGHPQQAIYALRAALSYAPDDRSYLLMLAQALADAGRTDEATSYFLNLWDARPGDGFINLQLARLARRKGDAQEAIEYYRAAIFGDWQGTGLTRRREVRLELADYLTERHDLSAARAELLIGAGNAPDDPQLNLLFGDKLLATGDLADGLTFYRKAIAEQPHSRLPLEKAGRVAYLMGDYPVSHAMIHRALQLKPGPGQQDRTEELVALERSTDRLMELSLSRELPARERGQHILAASAIAQARLNSCSAHLAAAAPAQAAPDAAPSASTAAPAPDPTTTNLAHRSPTVVLLPSKALSTVKSAAAVASSAAADSPSPAAASAAPPAIAELRARWKLASTPSARRAILSDADIQDDVAQLIFDTERQTAGLCGPPTGDDALLLQLANVPSSVDSSAIDAQSAAQPGSQTTSQAAAQAASQPPASSNTSARHPGAPPPQERPAH